MYIYDNISFSFPQNENVLDKFIVEIKTNFIFDNFFFRKSRRLWKNAEKYDRARQAKDINVMCLKLFTYWITNTTNTRPEFVVFILRMIHFICVM
jgi:hypothetical protein